MLIGFFLTCLASTLAGQIAGSLVFEALNPNATALLGIWQTLTFIYPVERTIIALAAMIIGVSLVKVLRTANLLPSAIAFNKADPPQKAGSKRLFDDLSIPPRS
jgi:hypothetical protein